ncbi:MAG TPA: superinfection immunity protein [Acidobacteriaceae bacterium]|nr:superinfection immunity protein [Acidobacteriaceae bacterium]
MPQALLCFVDPGFPVVLGLLILFGGVFLYFLPSVIARSRRVVAQTGIVLVNLFLGWTVLGWFGALIWACTAESEAQARMREFATRQMMQGGYPAQYIPPAPQDPGAMLSVGRTLGNAAARVTGRVDSEAN